MTDTACLHTQCIIIFAVRKVKQSGEKSKPGEAFYVSLRAVPLYNLYNMPAPHCQVSCRPLPWRFSQRAR